MTPKTFTLTEWVGDDPPDASDHREPTAVYLRVSSDEQRENETILTQRAVVERYLAGHPELQVVEWYIDDGVTGTIPLTTRPSGGRLMKDARQRRFTKVLVARADRVGRDIIDLLQVRDFFAEHGIEIVGAAEELGDELSFDLLAVLAKHERKRFLARSRDGMERAAREGRYTGGIVRYGFHVVGEKKDARFVLDDEVPIWADQTAAEIILWIYERCALHGWSCRRIADELNARGVPTHYARDGRGVRMKATRGVWRQGRVYNLLKQPAYKGVHQYGRRSARPREVIEVTGPAIVSPELWQAAQDMLTSNRLMPKNTTTVYLLRSLIRCEVCGLTYHGTNGNGGARYTCGGRQRERSRLEGRCYGRSLAAKTIEPLVLADVRALLMDPGDLLYELRPELDGTDHIRSQEADRASLQRHLNDLQGREDSSIRLCTRGTISEEKLDELLAEIATERSSITERLAAIEEQASDSVEPLPDDLLAILRARIDDLTPEEWQQVLQHLVAGITVHTTLDEVGKKSVRIVVNYTFPEPDVCVPPCTGTRARFDSNKVLRAQRVVVLQ